MGFHLFAQIAVSRFLANTIWFIWLQPDLFNEVLTKITTLIKRQDTPMRQAISPEIRMAIILHYLAAGELINFSCGLMSSQSHIIAERYPNLSLNKI